MANQLRRSHFGWAVLTSALLFVFPVACSGNDVLVTLDEVTEISSPQSESFQLLLDADILYLGEVHNSVADHAAQLEILESIYAQNPNVAIALEMFQRPFQPVIDRYLAGEISEAELLEQTEYESRWGFPWEYYAPIVRFALEKQLPLLALNAPNEIVSQVSRQGLDSLEGDDFRYIAPLEAIDTSNVDYKNFVTNAFSHHSHDNFNFDNFFAAQVIWDETMAMTIADFKQANPDTQVVVLAGQGHVAYGYGIPDRVARRLGNEFTQKIVLLNPAPEIVEEHSGAIADLFWYTE